MRRRISGQPLLHHIRISSGLVPPQRRSGRPLSSPITAGLWSFPEHITYAMHVGNTVGFVCCIGLSALPILTGDAKERNERRFLQPNSEEGAENIRWGVMSALAFLPFLNPMAWVFGALDDEDSSILYWTFAWMYTLPYITNGFELDWYAVLALILGIAHMQIERIGQTEPVEVELPQVIRALLRSLPRAVTAIGRYGSSVGEEVSGRVGRSAEAEKRKPDRKYLEEKSRQARMEFDEFDRRRKQREKEKQRDRE